MSNKTPTENIKISIQESDFSIEKENHFLSNQAPEIGAVVTFTGRVREFSEQPDVTGLFLEHYPGMTEKALTKIAEEAQARWSLGEVLVIHRHGPMAPGERIMMVATASPHRQDAFEAAEFLMDYLKSRAPFWKKERSAGDTAWVAARDEDEAALDRW